MAKGTVRDRLARTVREHPLCRAAFANSSVGVGLLDVDSECLVLVNPALCGILGYRQSGLLELEIIDSGAREALHLDSSTIRRLSSGQSKIEECDQRSIRKDGRLIWMHLSLRALENSDGGITHILVQVRDITRAKLAYDKFDLHNVASDGRSNDRPTSVIEELERIALAQAQTVARIGSWAWDLDTNLGTWTPELYRIFDREPGSEPFSYDAFLELVRPDDRGALDDAVQRAVYDGTSFAFDFRGLLPDGNSRWFTTRGLVQIRNGVPIGMIGTIQDIDERRRIEDSLRQSQSLLHGIAENSPSPIYMKDRDGHYLFVNRAFEAAVGRPRDEILGHCDEAIFSAHMARTFRANDEYTMRKNRPIQRKEIGVAHGEQRTFDSVKFPLADAQGTIMGTCGISTDITEWVHAEEVRRKERERIALEIHDDSVQVMASLALRLEGLEATAKDDEQRRRLEALKQDVRGSINRLRRLMLDLKTQMLEGKLEPALRAELERVKRDHSLSFSLMARMDHEPSLSVASAVFRITREALSNIVKHARATHIDVRLACDDGGVLICVSDNGVGFDRPEASPQGHLGLSSMRSLADNVGGHCRIDTSPGKGTRVEARLPALLRFRSSSQTQ